MQEPLLHVQGNRLTLTKVLQDILKEFLWIDSNVDVCPTWLFELVALNPTVGSHQDTFGYMCGYVILQGTRSVPRFLQKQTRSYLPSLYPSAAHPIIWRAHFPSDVVRNLITWDNPQGKFIKSELELLTSVLHHDCIAYFSDVLKKKTSHRQTTYPACGGNRKYLIHACCLMTTSFNSKYFTNVIITTYPATFFSVSPTTSYLTSHLSPSISSTINSFLTSILTHRNFHGACGPH